MQMRSYGCRNKYGERRSLFSIIRLILFRILFEPIVTLFLIDRFYSITTIVVYVLLNIPYLFVESASLNFFDHQKLMQKADENPAWIPPIAAAYSSSVETRWLTAETYPFPIDQARCDNNYLKLNFVCDPDNFLSHTEAIIINATLGKKFFHCFSSSSSNNELATILGLNDGGGGRGGGGANNNDPRSEKHATINEDAINSGNSYYSNHSPKGNRHWAKIIQRQRYTIGIALAKTMQEGSLESCDADGKSIERQYDLDRERGLNSLLEKSKVLPKMATKLRRHNWLNRDVECKTDILILLVKNVITCDQGSKASFSAIEPLMALSFSNRVKHLLSEVSATNLEHSRRRWKNDHSNFLHTNTSAWTHKQKHYFSAASNCKHRNCVINMIRRIMQVLDDSLPFLADTDIDKLDDTDDDKPDSSSMETGIEKDERSPDNKPPKSITWFAHPQHSVPTWALIAFAVSVCVTLACACLGHWVNTGRSRLHASSDAANAAKYHLHDRRWRAGFGGGMLELHNQQKGGGGGGGVGVGGGFNAATRGAGSGTQTRMVRAKMFGGIGMGPSARSRQMNGTQHNYHRV